MSLASLPLFMAALSTVPSAASAPASHERPAWRFHADHVLGTSLDITAVGAPVDAAVATRAASDEIARLDRILSGWRADSELAALNRSSQMTVSPDLYHVVASAERWRGLTDGAFDGRLGAVEALWRDAERTGQRPDRDRLAELAAAARAEPLGLDPEALTIHRPQAAVLALDGIAKGHVIDQALAAALRAAPALQGLMIDLGGDLRCWGQAPGPGGWTLAVFDPRHPADNAAPAAFRQVAAGALATSGCGPRDRRIGGVSLSSLLDPRDGRPAANLAAAALAETALDADAMSTALMVMPPQAGQALARKLGLQGLGFDGGGQLSDAPGWTRVAAPAGAPSGPWPSGFVVTVEYEAPKIVARRVHSPYMAVWVTDQNNRLVRALALIGNDPNYIDQNFIWWRRHGRGAPDIVDALSRPTRAPGRYTAVWDGKDDAGKPVALGKYTVHVEAIREHGGHSYQAMPLDLTQGPAEAQAAASDELGPARVRFGPRTPR